MLKLKNRYDDEKLCNNPDKGWYAHYYDNDIVKYCAHYDHNDTLDDFPMMDHAYLRVAWGYLEPKEGEFNWQLLDQIIDPWVAAGKRVSFRVSCKETNMQLDGYATPKWVFDAGAKYTVMPNGCIEPDYGDPIFLEKLNNFHRAFAERYDGRDEVVYIDLGSYGDWGEFHCCSSSRKDWPVEVIKKHIDIHVNNYKHTQLVISDDVVGSRDTGTREEKQEILNYIIDNGITIRDDGISVTWFAERFGFNTLRSEEIYDRAWRKFPTILELEHYDKTIESGWYLEGWPFLASVQGSHATYAGFHGEPRKWLAENPELAIMMANQLGYWYFLYGIDVAEKIGNSFNIKFYWENKGAAPSYKGYKLDVILAGDNGTFTIPVEKFDSNEMMPHTITVRDFDLKTDAPKGKYKLSVRMHNDADRTIELGMQDEYRNADGSYYVTDVEVI